MRTPGVEKAAYLRAWARAETRLEGTLDRGEASVTWCGGEPRSEVGKESTSRGDLRRPEFWWYDYTHFYQY